MASPLPRSGIGVVRAESARRAALIALLIAEIVYLTIAFDTQGLERDASPWIQALGWAPQYLRLAIAALAATLVLSTRSLVARDRENTTTPVAAPSFVFLIAHASAFLLFFQITGGMIDGTWRAIASPAALALAWVSSGAATLATWTLTLFPLATWRRWLRQHAAIVGAGIVLGAIAWGAGFATETLWRVLARQTFGAAGWLLGAIYPDVVSKPDRLILGTTRFRVGIAPECSGYEGIGLVLAFLGVYLWTFKRDLRFPHALALLPIGAVAIWILNIVRIVALIAIGSAGWRAVALGGFHSQAGWLTFNAVGLLLIVALNRLRVFAKSNDQLPRATSSADPTPAYLMPFLVVLASAMVTGAFSAGLDWLYPVRVVAAVAALWIFRRHYSTLRWSWSWPAMALGAVTFVVWLSLVPAASAHTDGWPAPLQTASIPWSATWLILRIVGYVVTVPIVEELAFRGYLTRRLMGADFAALPVGIFSWSSFLLSSALFGAFHGAYWLAGTVSGMAFALALYQRRAFGDAVQAHATTNGLIALYVLTTGRWSVWS
jgi:exosortase E/protease (VPEID-CTERM system)